MNTHQNSHDVTDERHRSDCAACQTLWAELESISAEAARLPQLTPSRDLWSGIEARISGSAPRAARPFYSSQAFRLAIAASLLVTVSSAVTWRLATSSAPTDAVAALPVGDGEVVESALHLASFNASVSQMDREIAALQAIVTERRSELEPQTVTVLETNLRLIDQAIAESRAALEADPASQFLATQFTRAYTSKLTLLRDAATLPVGI
jgi:hypothetical protein